MVFYILNLIRFKFHFLNHFQYKDLFLLAFLGSIAGCQPKNSWICDALATYDPEFDSKRLIHEPSNGYPPWKIELLRGEETIKMFISLTQYEFHPITQNSHQVLVTLHIQEFEQEQPQIIEDLACIFEGGMKAQFSDSLTTACIQALQEGKKVSILVGKMQETLESAPFKKQFGEFLKTSYDWYTNIQMPLK